MAVSKKRADGLIWVDRSLPYKLKYHLNGNDYVVETSAVYEINSALASDTYNIGDIVLPAGTLVKLSDNGESITKAAFPDDLEEVLGILTTDVKKLSKTTFSDAIISRNAYLTITQPCRVFKEFKTLTSVKESDFKWVELGKKLSEGYGCPIYWFIGESDASSYTDPSNYPGMLTFNTPSGYRGIGSSTPTPSLNVSYSNLPQIGNLVKVDIKNQKIEIHLNFSRFDSTLEWSWPGIHNSDNDCGKIEATISGGLQSSNIIDIRHGLFANDTEGYNIRSFCNIVALNKHEIEVGAEGEDPEESIIQAPVKNKVSGNDRGTIITISSPEALYYRISGRVNYKFDKGGN